MALIKSISGIRGTIGGKPGDTLSPLDVVKFTAAFGSWLIETTGQNKVVIGRDGRISGPMVSALVSNTLMSMGINVVDLGLSTTPTVEIAVTAEQAAGGIIITASHNPKEWNALKLLNNKGEFISGDDGIAVLKKAEKENFIFAPVEKLGFYTTDESYLQKHIDLILALDLVDTIKVAAANLKIVVDAVNSTGAIFVPALLNAMGVTDIIMLNGEVDGNLPIIPNPFRKPIPTGR